MTYFWTIPEVFGRVALLQSGWWRCGGVVVLFFVILVLLGWSSFQMTRSEQKWQQEEVEQEWLLATFGTHPNPTSQHRAKDFWSRWTRPRVGKNYWTALPINSSFSPTLPEPKGWQCLLLSLCPSKSHLTSRPNSNTLFSSKPPVIPHKSEGIVFSSMCSFAWPHVDVRCIISAGLSHYPVTRLASPPLGYQ